MCDLPTLAYVYWYKTESENVDVFASNINRHLKRVEAASNSTCIPHLPNLDMLMTCLSIGTGPI